MRTFFVEQSDEQTCEFFSAQNDGNSRTSVEICGKLEFAIFRRIAWGKRAVFKISADELRQAIAGYWQASLVRKVKRR